MAIIKINGTEIPTPQVYKVQINDVDSIGERSATGLLIRGRFATKRKIMFTYNVLTDEAHQAVLEAISPEFFQVEYLDPINGPGATGTFYVGDRQSQAYMYLPTRKLWVDITFNLIER